MKSLMKQFKYMKQFIFDNWLLLSPILYEIIARVWPTKWNISLLDNIWKFIDFWIPNKRIPDGKEKMVHLDETENIIIVPTRKHILKIILILCVILSAAKDPVHAQIWQNFKGVRLVNNSDTTKQFPVQGSIFFDDVNNTFWGHNSVGWKNFINVGNAISGLTSPRIPFALSASTLGDDAALTWDNLNKILIVGNGTNGQFRFNVLTEFDIKANTADGSDNKVLSLTGGGDDNITRGAVIKIAGNENTTQGNGVLDLFSGNAVGASIRMKTGSAAAIRLKIDDLGISRFVSPIDGIKGIDINPTSRLIENSIVGSFGINNGVGDLNLSGTNNLTLNTTASTRLRINSAGGSRFSSDNLITGIDVLPAQKRIENIGAGTFSIENNVGILNLISSSQMLLNPATLLNISASGGTFITTTPPTNNTAGLIAIKVDGQIVKRDDITAGTFTPTITNQSNVSASNLIANTTTFMRIQNIVRVETAVNITATATTTLTQIGISLPVVSDLGAASISGMGVAFTIGENEGEITGDIINDVARFNFTSVSTSATFWRISFQYTVN